jgi:hypothetical protein
MRPRQRAHLAATGEKIRRSRSVDFQHLQRSVASRPKRAAWNLAACHNPGKLTAAAFGSKYILNGWNKIPGCCAATAPVISSGLRR